MIKSCLTIRETKLFCKYKLIRKHCLTVNRKYFFASIMRFHENFTPCKDLKKMKNAGKFPQDNEGIFFLKNKVFEIENEIARAFAFLVILILLFSRKIK